MTTNAMLDLETLGTNQEGLPVVLSIGMSVFELDGEGYGNSILVHPNRKQQINTGSVMEYDTVKWWMQQSDQARNDAFCELPPAVVYIDEAGRVTKGIDSGVILSMERIYKFCVENTVNRIWGNGASFDNVILRGLFHKANVQFPTGFWTDMDLRTLHHAAELIDKDRATRVKKGKRRGTHHNALDDVHHQIWQAQQYWGIISEK